MNGADGAKPVLILTSGESSMHSEGDCYQLFHDRRGSQRIMQANRLAVFAI